MQAAVAGALRPVSHLSPYVWIKAEDIFLRQIIPNQWEETGSACVSMVALVGPNRSSSRGSQDSVDSAVIIAGASEPTL